MQPENMPSWVSAVAHLVQYSASKTGKGRCYLGITHMILSILLSVPSILSKHSQLMLKRCQRVHFFLILGVSIYKYIYAFIIPADSTCFHHFQKITSCFIQEYVILTVLKLSPISFIKCCPVLAGFQERQFCLLFTQPNMIL